MKVKIFISDDLRKLEKSVNKFIKDKCVISIYQSEIGIYDCDIKQDIPCLTITVLYDDEFKNGYVKCTLEQEIMNNIAEIKNS
jgi:hypothetical protein